MAEFFLDNIYLTLFIPLWIFLIIMVGRFFSVYVNKIVIYFLTLFSSFLGMILSFGALYKMPYDKVLMTSFPFLKINDFIIEIGLHIDKIALVFATVLFLVSFLVQIFSISYMKNEKRKYRFFALMNLFNFSMTGLFFSANLFETYFFWEIAGIVSYLLIGFEYVKEKKSIASKKVFIINRIGDTSLIGAIILCSYFIYAYAPNKALVTLSFSDMNVISTLVYAYASNPLFEIICSMFIVASLVKSAQFPFYTWLQDAMEAKLPVSALLHSATLVAAGVFLTLRLLPFYTLEPALLSIITLFGVLTAFVCSLSACSQTEPKKTLAYSTSAQLGLIFFAIGILNIKAAVVCFIAHAVIKSMLFLSLPKDNAKWDYIKFVAFLVGGLSLSGLLFSGLIAKELICVNLGTLGVTIVSLLSFLTAFYIIRLALVMYERCGVEKQKTFILEKAVIIGLLISNILFYVYLHIATQYKVAEPFWAALTAWICVYILYLKNAFWKVPLLYPITYNGFYLDYFYTNICGKAYDLLTKACGILDTKIFTNYQPLVYVAKTGVNIFGYIENKFINGGLNVVVKIFKKISLMDLKAQDGNIQKYNTYAFIILTVILICLLIYIGG